MKQKIETLVRETELQVKEKEIIFFKDTKPKLFCKLIYYQNIYHIALQCPMTGAESRKKYLKRNWNKSMIIAKEIRSLSNIIVLNQQAQSIIICLLMTFISSGETGV
ncbi:RteC domain-containing protein [Bacteroidales bacterium OttesenSCG-928-L14]|nr:RteC domain-containing protein [Bacteroidales bacterium OttesenSCG-928-L14]